MSAPGNKRRTSKRDDWETPPRVFEALNSEFQFALDVCADEHNRKCERWLEGPCTSVPGAGTNCYGCCDYPGGAEGMLSDGVHCYCGSPSVCNCGLCADWLGNVCFMNPPYSAVLDWVQKAVDAANKGATVVALLPNNTDTAWFRQCWVTADEIRFVVGRIQFEIDGKLPVNPRTGSSSGNTGGSVIIVWWPQRTWRAGTPPRVSMWYQA